MERAARRGVITGGTWCLDRNKMIDRWPSEDQVAEILSEEARGGGSGCNLAVDMRKLDPALPVETIALVGDDEDGRFLMAEADAHGIDRRQMHVTRAAPTHYTDAFGSRASGRRTHIYNAGVAHLLSPDHFDFTQTPARFLHLGLPGTHRVMDAPWGEDANGWVTVLKKARAAGLETNLELMSASDAVIAALTRPCLPHLDLLIVNDVEIGAIAGETSSQDGRTDVGACVRAARHVLESGAMRIVAVHFPMGAVAVTRTGELYKVPSVAVPSEAIAAANGAGDAFASGFLYGVHEGWTVPDSLALAHATAAASLRGLSTTGAVESWQNCLALARAWGTRPSL
jgi:sugar/nucleoside kinase (ribokinase family)